MEEFKISFNTLAGILASAYLYYKRRENNLKENERWESLVRDNLETFIIASKYLNFKIIGYEDAES